VNIRTTEGRLTIIAALLVVVSALWEPRLGAVVAVAALAILGIYQIIKTRKK
jgi:hypothetical protein